MNGFDFSALVDEVADAILVIDQRGKCLYANVSAENLFGFAPAGRTLGIPLEDFAVVSIPTAEGVKVAEARSATLPDGEAPLTVLVLRDVSERESLKSQLTQRLEESVNLVSLLSNLPFPVARLRHTGEILWANDLFSSAFGDQGLLLSHPLFVAASDDLASMFDRAQSEGLASALVPSEIEEGLPIMVKAVRLGTEQNDEFGVVIETPLENDDLLTSYLRTVASDAELGIPNDRGLALLTERDWSNSALEQSVFTLKVGDEALENSSGRVVEVMMLLDDEWEEIQKSPGSKGTLQLGRPSKNCLSGVIASERTSPMGSARLMETLISRLQDLALGNIRAGTLSDTRAAPSIAEAINASHQAAHEAEFRGKDTLSFEDDFSNELARRQHLRTRVRRAVAERAFSVALQPRVSLETGKVVAAEMLARLRDDDPVAVSPDEFVPILQELGAIDELTQVVVNSALELTQRWRANSYEVIPLSINISPSDMSRPRTLSIIRSLARSVESHSVELEMSEMEHFDKKAVDTLRALLESLGIQVSLDDFGKGYSSFHYLVNLPIGVIKVDKSFASLLDDPSKRDATIALYRTVVALARELKIVTCAEGVETKDQVELVKALGIDQAQGFYYSEPLTPEEFEDRYLSAGS